MRKKRRSRGTGSIYFESLKNRWACAVELGKDADGKRLRRTLYAKIVAELERKIRDERARGGGSIRPKTDGTVGDWIADWVRDDVQPNRAAATYISYEGAWRLHAEPILGHVPIDDLRVEHVTMLVRRLRSDGTSAAMIARVLRVMHRAITVAMRQGRFHGANPFAAVEKPRGTVRTTRSLSIEECQRFLAAAADCRHEALWVVLLTTGLRLGEAVALRWPNVDLSARKIAVRQSRSEAGGSHDKGPKNASSRRVVRFGDIVAAALDRRKAAHAKEGHGSALVFCSGRGTSLLRSNLYRQHFAPMIARAGIAGLRIHDLRHTSASIGMAGGVTPKAMAERLGHATTRMTMAVYAHVMEGMDAAVAETIDGSDAYDVEIVNYH